ncbi:MAG: hypothetical protein Q4E06_12820 [Lautropia sp.]|nr:hypothetical protein [Lautropia sp.]
MSGKLNSSNRQLYSGRTGRFEKNFQLDDLKIFFKTEVDYLEKQGLFEEWFGGFDSFGDWYPGKAGNDNTLFVYRRTGKEGLWPLGDMSSYREEDDVFDMMELLFDCSSVAVRGDYDREKGRGFFRERMNPILHDYRVGLEISDNGELLLPVSQDFHSLMVSELDFDDLDNVVSHIESAKRKFRSRKDGRRDAIRDLFGVLENLKTGVESSGVLHKRDESDLFHIANKFGIRHNNKDQKTDYDEKIWMSWMFYFCLATIHAYIHLLKRRGQKTSGD